MSDDSTATEATEATGGARDTHILGDNDYTYVIVRQDGSLTISASGPNAYAMITIPGNRVAAFQAAVNTPYSGGRIFG